MYMRIRWETRGTITPSDPYSARDGPPVLPLAAGAAHRIGVSLFNASVSLIGKPANERQESFFHHIPSFRFPTASMQRPILFE